jgi:hypothetical protein
MNNLSNTGKNELIETIIDVLKDRGEGMDSSELHHECFNTDYFLIGYYDCEQWLKNNYGIFAAIEEIKEYEQNNFGEVTTDLSSSENVLNMLVYILGEKIINQLDTECDIKLTKKSIKKLIKQLEQ